MKKYVFGLILVLFATQALAQPQPPQAITMTTTLAEAQQILNALGQGPWKDVNPLMQKLIAEINPQITPPPAAPSASPQAEAPKAPSKFIPPRSSPETPLPLHPKVTPLPPVRPKPPLPHPEK